MSAEVPVSFWTHILTFEALEKVEPGLKIKDVLAAAAAVLRGSKMPLKAFVFGLSDYQIACDRADRLQACVQSCNGAVSKGCF